MSSVSGDDNFKSPQDALNDFWENLITKQPGKVTNIFPSSLYANLLAPQRKSGPAKGRNAAESYQAAADECRARVKRIVRECHRTNEKFTDPEFDIESDLTVKNCLEGISYWLNDPAGNSTSVGSGRLGEALTTLAESNLLAGQPLPIDLNAAAKILGYDNRWSGGGPGSVHRIDWIFENPSFTVDGYSSSDVKQGANGDCWFIAALATICSNPGLMDRICVERDEECGVYGFVFYRDGEWIWTVVDDNLYLTYSDFDAYGDDYDPTGVKEKKHKKNDQTGSDALYFASCADQNETWLPLLEKAYAKVHGDYEAISGGISGEAVEDLTGGVTTKLLTNRVLSKERLWNELLEINKQFLFSASSPDSYGDDSNARQGLALNHAYSIIKAVEEADEDGKKHRLVLIRNPWGERANASMGEWNGAWSDGSKEWTPYWMEKLNHRFGNDGLFWMSYDDLRKRFELLDRTRLFDKDWTVVQNWTSVSVAWVTGYLNTKFVVEIKKAGPTIFVLCQLDDRYFRGLEGKYKFDLHFVLQEENASSGDHIVRARGAWFGNRSISAEVDLEPGKYEVIPKIVASRDSDARDVYDVVTKMADRNPQKLRQIGMNYDIANAKGVVELTAEEKKKKAEKKKASEEKKRKEKEDADKDKADFEAWKKEKKEREEKEKADAEKSKGGKEEAEKKEPVEAEKKEPVEAEKKEPVEAEKKEPVEAEKKEPVEAEKKEPVEAEKKEPVEAGKEDAKAPEAPVTEKVPEEKEVESAKPEGAQAVINKEEKPTEQPDSEATPPPAPKEDDSSGDGAENTPPSSNTSPSRAVGVTRANADYAADEASGPPLVPPAPPAVPVVENKQNPWNAICVLGLRVYSQDPEVSIKLVKPKDAEEAAVLDADGGATQVGATM